MKRIQNIRNAVLRKIVVAVIVFGSYCLFGTIQVSATTKDNANLDKTSVSRDAYYGGVNYAPVFDYEYYINRYVDINRCFANNPEGALNHYVTMGIDEGRQASANFDITSYRYANQDLRLAFGKYNKGYVEHYLKFGIHENRRTTNVDKITDPVTKYNGIDYRLVYDYEYYKDHNPDLVGVFADDDVDYIKHFATFGVDEFRYASASFEASSYRNAYRDLRRAFGNNYKMYYLHYIDNGCYEYRDKVVGISELLDAVTVYNGTDYSDVYDYYFYVNKYPDIRDAFGNNDYAVLEHFIHYGMDERRQANQKFDVVSYRKKYQDLRVAFGCNMPEYYYHYINYGKAEKRVCIGVYTLQNPLTIYYGVDLSEVYDYYYYVSHNRYLLREYDEDDDYAMLKHFALEAMPQNKPGKENYDQKRYEELRETLMYRWLPPLAQ